MPPPASLQPRLFALSALAAHHGASHQPREGAREALQRLEALHRELARRDEHEAKGAYPLGPPRSCRVLSGEPAPRREHEGKRRACGPRDYGRAEREEPLHQRDAVRVRLARAYREVASRVQARLDATVRVRPAASRQWETGRPSRRPRAREGWCGAGRASCCRGRAAGAAAGGTGPAEARRRSAPSALPPEASPRAAARAAAASPWRGPACRLRAASRWRGRPAPGGASGCAWAAAERC